MPNSIQAIYILIVLLPGFLVVTIVELLTGVRVKESHRFIVQALASSFAVYVIYLLLVGVFSLPDISVVATPITSGEKNSSLPSLVLSVDPLGVLILFFFSVLLAGVLSLVINKDWMRILRKLGLTRGSHEAQPWDGAFRSTQHWVIVKLGNGEKVLGWPKRMSSRETQYSLSLQDAAWVRNDGTLVEIDTDEFLITGDIDWVQFHKRNDPSSEFSQGMV